MGRNSLTTRTWVYSDPHFFHNNICKFINYDGTKVRPWDDVLQMNEDMITWYNEMVNDEDRVYMLGDMAFSAQKMRDSIGRMKGRKVLVPGNHEPTKMRKYFDLFDDVRGYVVKKGFIMSHMPIHSSSMGRWQLNIHGHLHNNTVKNIVNVKGDYIETETEDPRYFCACVERTNFRPVLLDEILNERGLK